VDIRMGIISNSEIKENNILKVAEQFEKGIKKKYKTQCVFCGRSFITEVNTANEGICIDCRTV